MTMTRRNSHLEAEAEEETLRRQISAEAVAETEPIIYTPAKATPTMENKAQAPHDAVHSDFDLVCMAEAEEHSLAIDRRQISIMEAEAIGGRRRLHGEKAELAACAVETPQNSHHLAGLAEAEEMAWGMDRQASAMPHASFQRRPSENSETEPESPQEALTRRCSHELAASAEAEEIGYYDSAITA